ncbi:hypothetical protein BSL78_04321 [Apostichopus japonicus]|uniref:ZU5 domain-containing protein n=1 Tax=Stichopus japonicus TaxID=307972 RepID=A0A2G8LEQ2_STIJA|nr:hypothetical protein BSL78_04321 [Apostichopus japonicus]
MANNWNEDVSKTRQMSETVLTQGVRKTVVNELYGKIQYVPYIRENIFNAGDDLLVRLEPEDKQRRFQRMRHAPTHKSQHNDVLHKGNENSKSSVNPSYNQSILLLQDVADYIQPNRRPEEAPTDNQLRNILTRNPVLSEICEIPLFALMLAHMSNKNVEPFASLTSFFKSTLMCYYDHMWKAKMRTRKSSVETSTLPNHDRLNKLSFDCLTAGRSQRFRWPKNEFRSKVGNECFNELIAIGILIEEDNLGIPGKGTLRRIVKKMFVRFYHNIFVEWFAANYLSSNLGSFFSFSIKNKLKEINPSDHQFLFRFACGLNQKASENIIKYIKKREGGDYFAAVCSIEQVNEIDYVVDLVKTFCSDGMVIKTTDGTLQQKSQIQLLSIASTSKIPVPVLKVEGPCASFRHGKVILQSGVLLPGFSSVEQILIKGKRKAFTEEEVIALLRYGQQCHGLTELRFEDCSLPQTFNNNQLTPSIKSWNVPVLWNSFRYSFQLDLACGLWKVAEPLVINLSKCKIEKDKIRMKTGLVLPSLLSVEKILIKVNERKVTEEEILGISSYGQRCRSLKEIRLDGCLVPMSINPKRIPKKLKSWSVKVYWRPFDYDFLLNFSSGQWVTDDLDSVRKICSEAFSISGTQSTLQKMSAVTLLGIANSNSIAVPCLVLDPSNCKYENNTIRLESGVRLASIRSLQKILIKADGRDLTAEDVIGIASYGQHCNEMKELRFQDCLLPLSIDPKKITQRLRSWKVQVNWRPSDQGFLLNLQSGEWETTDSIESLTQFCSDTINLYKRDTKSQHRSIVQLLHIAAKRNITISCLHLYRSFVGICDENIISLNSKIRLACPSLVQMIGINTEEEGRELTETEFVRVFGDCLLPMSIPAASVPIKLKLKNVKVLWNPRDAFLQYNLDLESGRWINGNTKKYIRDAEYAGEVSKFRVYWRYTEFQKARLTSARILKMPQEVLKLATKLK